MMVFLWDSRRLFMSRFENVFNTFTTELKAFIVFYVLKENLKERYELLFTTYIIDR